LSYIVVIHYEDLPVRPYDELIAVSDGYANPYEKGTSGRITNIHVNSRQSVWKGAKAGVFFFCPLFAHPRPLTTAAREHFARFDFIPTDSKTFNVKIFLPDADVPFFTASIAGSSIPGLIPGVPFPPFLLDPFMHIVPDPPPRERLSRH
jgi:hypothetical protein